MKSVRRNTWVRILSAAVALLMIAALLPSSALAADADDGLVVERLTFRDVLAAYASGKDSFGENAAETDESGVTNAAKNLAELCALTVGLNYTGEGLNCNYFGKDISAQMGADPYTDENLIATYDVEILPTRSYAVALPQGQTTAISVYRAGYTNAASGGVEMVLHYVWQDQGTWYAVKDDNPYYRVSYNGKSARALSYEGLTMTLAHAENGTSTVGAWENLSTYADGAGFVTLSDSTLIGGQGSAFLLGVTDNFGALASENPFSRALLAVSDFLGGDTTYQTGPLVYKRECYEAGTAHRIVDGEALQEGHTYEFRVQYDEALSVAAGADASSVGLILRSELTNDCFAVDSFDWLGSSEHLTGDEFNPYTITFTYTPSTEGSTVCSLIPINLNGETSALAAAEFHVRTETTAPASAVTETVTETVVEAAPAETAVEETPVETAAPAETPVPEAPAVAQTALTENATPQPLASAQSDAPATRALLARTLWEFFGRPAVTGDTYFTDMPADADTAQAVRWAAQSGLIVGYGDGTFRPETAVTREQAAVILCRCAALRGSDTSVSGDLSAWSDGASVSSWAQSSVLWALQHSVLSARYDGMIAPQDTADCATVTAMLSSLRNLG